MIWFWRILTWLRFALLGLLVLFVTLLALVSAIVATEPGSRLAINFVADRIPMVELGRLEGNLLTGLDIRYVDYQFEDQRYRVDGLAFRWQPLALFYSAVSVQSLKADAVLLVLPEVEQDQSTQVEQRQWPSLALPVRIELGQVDLRNIRIEQGETVTELAQISGSVSHGTFNLRVFDLTVVASDYQVTASGRMGLRFPYSSEFDVDWQYRLPATGDYAELPLAGRAELQGNIEHLELRHWLSAPILMETRAQITPHLMDEGREPHLQLDNRWEGQSPPANFWPLEQPLPVTSLQLTFEGWLDSYRLQMGGDLQMGEWPKLELALEGQGDLAQLHLDRLGLEAEGITLNSSGQLAWAAPATEHNFSWDLALAVEEFNPELLFDDWPGRVGLEAHTRGHLNGDQMQAQVESLSLSGLLRGLELSGSGGLSYMAGRLDARNLNLALGANQLSVNGYLADTFDLQWHLAAPILGQLDASLGGSLDARGQLDGTMDKPHLELAVVAEQLRWQDYLAQKLSLTLERDSAGAYQLDGGATDVQMGERQLQSVDIEGAGTLERHRVGVNISSEESGALGLVVISRYREQSWQGSFEELNLHVQGLPRWQLLRSEPMSFSTGQFELGEQCLTIRTWGSRGQRGQGGPGESETVSDDSAAEEAPEQDRPERETPELCLEGQWLADSGLRLDANILAIPLRTLRFWIKPEASLSGVIDGRLAVRQTLAQGLSANGQLRTRDGQFRYQYGEEDVDIYSWRSAELNVDFSNDELVANLSTDWDTYGSAEAELTLNTASRALAGNLRMRFGDLAPLEALIPRLHEISGSLNADVRLQGTLDQPVVVGQINLRDATAKLPELGLHFENIRLAIDSSENGRVQVAGGIDSGQGSLALKAEALHLGQPNWQIHASVEGENFQIIQDRQLQANISPNINARASAKEIRIEGLARIPKALANIKTLPTTATRLSDDVIILDGRANGNGAALGIPWYLNVRLQLGDDVRFEGFGLESRLSGELVLLRTPTRGFLTTGEVGVAEGVYKAYGQALKIERGRLIFQGPYDNPGLNIRAERTITNISPEVTVGLEIGGTLQRPRSRIFSTPTQSDSEAMAMLLTGRPLSSSSNADASMLVNAIGTLGLERSNFITAEIAQVFGLDELTVQTGDNLEESSLFIGKYLTPRLFVRYVVGLFDQTNSLGMRYQLTDGLRLEAESGLHQSVDLIYKFER